jgi:hypothetical protein
VGAVEVREKSSAFSRICRNRSLNHAIVFLAIFPTGALFSPQGDECKGTLKPLQELYIR